MADNVNEHQVLTIPGYNHVSLVQTVTRIVNQARRGLITDAEALDEIVRAYQDPLSMRKHEPGDWRTDALKQLVRGFIW